MSLKQKLQLYKKQLQQAQQIQKKDSEERHFRSSDGDAEMLLAARGMKAQVRHFDGEFALVHTEKLDIDLEIGPNSPRDLFHSVAAWQNGSSVHPLSARGLKTEDLLFFDTETTGLASGAGQMIFLIGMARVTGSGVILKQYFLPGPGHEAAFYRAFLGDCRSLKNLVTFNGKAFDWPRVKTRHQFVRDRVPRLPAFGHFDLLHASRRLWRNRLDSVGLQTVEKNILSMQRTADVPGKMAPFLYFQFLKHPDVQLVNGIIEHNREDVLSLISLYIHLSNKVLGRAACSADEQYEIARWYQQLGDDERALTLFKSLADNRTEIGQRSKAHLAALYKREGHYGPALNLMKDVIRKGSHPDDTIYIEAAKLMEHQFKDYAGAIHYTQRAIEFLEANSSGYEICDKKMQAYIHRINRLDEKLLRKTDG